MATTHPQHRGEESSAPVPATRGEPYTVIIVAVLGVVVATVIVLYFIFG